MGRISIRFATPDDGIRFVTDGLVSGPLPGGVSWPDRIASWRIEAEAGRRAILVAEDDGGLLGMVQLVFAFPPGYTDLEAADGRSIAMIESLRTNGKASARVLDQLVSDAQTVAKRRNIKTLTLCLPMANDRAILQAKSWGFAPFRLMPEPQKMLAFFRKTLA